MTEASNGTQQVTRYATLCSGIEAVSVALSYLGDSASPVFFSEIEPYPNSLLAEKHPDVPNLGDMMQWRDWDDDLLVQVDVIVAGTPCQAFSVAGGRLSLEDDRGNLTLEFVRICNAIDNLRRNAGKPEVIILWENVPGVLSVSDNAFGCLLAGLVGSDAPINPTQHQGWTGAGVVSGPQRTAAWRILDAQYFGVAQQRRRVFIVANTRNRTHPAKILFEPEGLRRDTPPSRKKGEVIAPCLTSSNSSGSSPNVASGQGTVVSVEPDTPESMKWPKEVTCTLNAAYGAKFGYEDQHALGGASLFVPAKPLDPPEPEVAVMASGQSNAPVMTDGCAPALTCIHEAPILSLTYRMQGLHQPIESDTCCLTQHNCRGTGGSTPLVVEKVALPINSLIRSPNHNGFGIGDSDSPAPTLSASEHHAVAHTTDDCEMVVRRLTPMECERLQGFPDGYTKIRHNGKPRSKCPDGPRYKALGNSMAVPVMRWILTRIIRQDGEDNDDHINET